MRDEAAERETAIAAADETCPRCGARRGATSATASTAACGSPP